jgi:hypothetical protein
MGPHRDMFVDYIDTRGPGLVVRLGDEAKTIPIVGRGTLCLTIRGHNITYADALHVPDLSVILLSSRVHGWLSPGSPFVVDHSGCFLTYHTFTVRVDDTEDCTLPCAKVSTQSLHPKSPPMALSSTLACACPQTGQLRRPDAVVQCDSNHCTWPALQL